MNLPTEPGNDRGAESAPHDGEMASCIQRFAERHPAPERLVDHFYRLAEAERRESRWQTRRFWQASFASAVAAFLVLAAGWAGVDWLLDSKDPYDIVAQEAKTTFRRGDALPAAIQVRQKARLDKLFSSFNKDFQYRNRVSLSGQNEFTLEGASLREVDGKKVAYLIYRTADSRLLLTVIPAEENAEWPGFLRQDGWVVMNEESPRTFVWRRGAFIYALVGNLPVERFKEFSAAVSERR